MSEVARGMDAATSSLLVYSGALTTVIFLSCLAMFLLLGIRSRTIKSFQSQISIFVGVYVTGELLELAPIQSVTGLPAELGAQIHLVATILITTIMWSRLFNSLGVVKKLVEQRPEPTRE